MSKKYNIFILLIVFLVTAIFLAITMKDGEITFDWATINFFRIPEIIVLTIGSAGAVVGTYVIHLLTKNKVADIGIVGVTSINLLLLTLIYWVTDISLFIKIRSYVLPLAYFFGSLLLLLLIYVLTFRYKNAANKIILIGIVFSLTISAISSMIISKMPHTKQVYITNFSLGSISTDHNILESTQIYLAYAFIGISLLLFFGFQKQIKIVYTDPEKALSLGINIKLIRGILFVVGAFASASSFICLGSLAFIGFISANIVYLFFKKTGLIQLLLSILIGLILMYIVYIFKQNIIPTGVPIGIISNIIAMPYLIFVVLKGDQHDR